MSNVDRQQTILSILQGLNGLDGLKQLFWEELNYERENKPLSPRQWPESARQPLAEDPILFASGGADNAFHVVYCRLKSKELSRGDERPIVNRLTREHPYALFVFSNNDCTDWHFLNVKYDENAEKRRLLRRITVRSGAGLRTAAERLCMLDLVDGVDKVDGELTPLAIQSAHDDAFDVEKVTKDFYREIANWYFWALKHATFPKDAPKEKDGHDHISVIRLITRLIFCWFIREKGLIPDVIFDEKRLAEMLDGFAPGKTQKKDSVFYRAVLQNLFFATLNTETDQRGWRRPGQNMMAHCLYRHKECFRDPKAGLEWFKDIPFLNGGLFECLDRDFGENANPRYLRVDGFSDRDDSRPTVPDFLFFGAEQEIDLSDDYGDKKFKKVRVRGLIDTLNRYKFTIEENTPLDQEVALDPELCGKVFENLLAAYNPETGTTARKATGSFYTPREIVDYMVDESLVAYLEAKLTTKNAENTKKRIRELLAYDAEMPEFAEKETEALIDAIDGLKALDPAVGSGAFPMGMLHKLVHVLGKLDPGNERWKAKQIAKLDDVAMREDAERIFRDNYDDYGRKLYLIENCIYGVDIQPIAVQIAKMRFFISLIVDQKVNPKSTNLGVRALPNLETKFVAANTLIGIEKPEQMLLRNPEIDKKEAELRKVREKHFTARTLKSKAKCREDDKRLRGEIAELLKNDGWDNTTAKQLAAWDPYDQNAHADFFDPEWMFGVNEGFDVVIGNPPYVLLQNTKATSSDIAALASRYATAKYKVDLYHLFIEVGINLLSTGGALTYITPNTFLKNKHCAALRKILVTRCQIHTVVLFYRPVFEDTSVDNLVFVCQLAASDIEIETNQITVHTVRDGSFSEQVQGGSLIDQASILEPNYAFELDTSKEVVGVLRRIEANATPFGDIGGSYFGIQTHDRTAFVSESKQGDSWLPVIDGGNVLRYYVKPSTEYVNFQPENVKSGGDPAIYARQRIVVRQIGRYPEGTICPSGVLTLNTIYNLYATDPDVDIKYLLGLINSRVFQFYWLKRFFDNKATFPKIKKQPLHSLPVIRCSHGEQTSIAKLVSRILAAKAADQTADTSILERKIDDLVYKLYGLTEEEIAIVEGATDGSRGRR